MNDMNEYDSKPQEFNRRDFLKSSSFATAMAMLGGVEILAPSSIAQEAPKHDEAKCKVAVIGLGTWGREILNTLSRLDPPVADIAAICDTYPAFVRRGSTLAPGAATTEDYKTILAKDDIKAVIVATPSHQHKQIVLDVIKARKHVYCEAPLAHTVEDARAIAAAAKAAPEILFQAGLQLRAEPQRHFLLPFIRSGALGPWVMARAQWHKKQSWRATASKPEREKELNWRLSKDTSPGLLGEFGCHPIDQATWFINAQPIAVSGVGSNARWKDDRDVPDTVQVRLEFPNGMFMVYDATLANSFDGEYEMFYGSDAAVMLRDNKAWMFKEVDSPLLGWEVYATKETFYKETGIVLKAGASKAVPADNAPKDQPAAAAQAQTQAQDAAFVGTPLSAALLTFLRNARDMSATAEDAIAAYGDDKEQLLAALAKVGRRPAAGFLEGFQATVTALKANEAVLTGQRIVLKPEYYALG